MTIAAVDLRAFRSVVVSSGQRACSQVGVLCAWLLVPVAASAQSGSGASVAGVDIHGFVSQGFIKTTANNYLAESKRGSLEFSEVGLNFTKSLTDELRIGAQLFARDLGTLGNYRPQFDWYYLDYRFWDWLGLRAGRTKLPFGLYNESNDVDSARVPILLPQAMYPIDQRDYLLAQTGGEAYGRVKLGSSAGALEYRAYGGTIFIPIPASSTPGVSVDRIDVPYLYGGRLMWATPLDGLQVGGSYQALRLNIDYALTPEAAAPYKMAGALPADFSGRIRAELPVKLWVASAEYSANDLLVAAEYGRWSVRVESDAPGLLPPTHTVSERFYAMASYRLARWFSPGIYYSLFYPKTRDRSGREQHQHDIAATARYDINENWLVKLEGHLMRGTAALNSGLNGRQPLRKLTKDWGLLIFKTTAYF